MGWFARRAARRRQEQADAIAAILDLDTPERIAAAEREERDARLAADGERRRQERAGLGTGADLVPAELSPKAPPHPDRPGMDAETYKTFVTGNPPGTYYQARIGRFAYDFHGIRDDVLLYAVADFRTHFPVEQQRLGPGDTFVQHARAQRLAAGRRPIRWCVQRDADRDALERILRFAGVHRDIDIRHVPPPVR